MSKPHLIGIYSNLKIWDPDLFGKALPNGPIQFFADDKSKPELNSLKDNAAAILNSISVANRKEIIPIIHLPFSIRFDNFQRPFFRAYIDKLIEYCQLFTEQSYIIMHLWPGGSAEDKRIEWINGKFPRDHPKSANGAADAKLLSPVSPTSVPINIPTGNGHYPILVLENMINMAEPKQLGEVSAELDNVGFCIDTAHVWGAGIDIRTPEKAKHYLAELEKNKVKIDVFHLNPPADPFGKIIDRHGDMDKTQMDPAVMKVFVDYGVKNNIICIIETPSTVNIKTITGMWIMESRRIGHTDLDD